MIEQELEELEEMLIETPDSIDETGYQELIQRVKLLREALEMVKKQ